MLSFTAPKLRIILSVAIAALTVGLAWNYVPVSLPSSAAGNSAPAVKRGPATIVLQDGYALPAIYDHARPSGDARPTTLATIDLDLDSFPELVSGYAKGNGGYIAIQRGNPEAFAPTRLENVQAISESRFPVAFLPETKVIELASAPEFIAVGDFDRDSNPDVITASRGDNSLHFAAGDGKGGFAAERKIIVPGRVTTLVSGEIDLPDNRTDLAVGIETENGGALLVFEGDNGIGDAPIGYELSAPADMLAIGQMDDSPWMDVTILAAGQISILHGRNPRDGRESAKRAASRLEQIDVPFPVRSFAVGHFIYDRDARNELALLKDDGTVAFTARGTLDTRPLTIAEARELRLRQMAGEQETRLANWKPESSQTWTVAESLVVMDPSAVSQAVSNNRQVLLNAFLSGQATSDLIVIDPASRNLRVFAVEAPPKREDGEIVSFAGPRAEMTLQTGGAPVAAISMRTSLFVRPGLILLKEGDTEPEIISAAPSATFTVTKTADTNDGVCNAADCSLREAHVSANGAAGADIVTLPNGTYQLTIANGGGMNEDGGANGDIDVNQDLTLNGTAAATTIIQAGTTTANGIDKVYGFNPLCVSPVSKSLNNVTIRFGRNTQPNGAPDISFTGGGVDYCNTGAAGTLTVTNSVFSDNTVVNSFGGGLNISTLPDGTGAVSITNTTFNNNRSPSDTFDAKGAGIRGNGSGNLTITGSTISNNQSGTTPNIGSSALGGGIHLDQPTGAILIQNSTVSGNTAQRHGGGVAIERPDGLATSAVTINQASVITGNTSNGGDTIGGGGQGGGVYSNIGPLVTVTLTGLTITNNVALAGTSSRGGGIASSVGGMNISFCRMVGNTASTGTGLFKTNGGGTVTATNNWWGCSGGPGTTGCQTAVLQAAPSVLTTSPFLQLRTTASPTTVLVGQGSALTTSFLLNSAGTGIAIGNLGALIGQSVTWSGVNGNISGAQTTIQAAGTATATYTGQIEGAGSATAQVDGGPASGSTNTAAITVTNTATWDGSASSDWNTPPNWTTDFVPTTTNSVDLPSAGVTNQPNLSAGNATVANLTINSGRSLTISGTRTLTVNGLLTMNGLNIDATAGLLEIGGTGTVTRTSGAVLGNMRKVVTSAPIANAAPAFVFTYPVGTATGFSPVTANFTAGSGSLTVLAIDGTAPATPALNDLTTLDRYWQLTETGALTAGLTFAYLASDVDGIEANYRMIRSSAGSPPIRFPNGTPCPGAGSPCVDPGANTIFASPVTSFNNFWTAGEPVAPTAANVSVSGRVFAEGQGLRNAIVTITDSTGATRSTRTSSFGYYSFADVAVGREYVVSVAGKGHTFQPRLVTVNDNVAGLDFIAEP